ncbi:MAG: P-type conjugative transfer protein TrbL [Hyphomicrobiales bacterium]|nr:P-type conjugative transfer protein TrbL [Hyphomicrobiales bacterium]
MDDLAIIDRFTETFSRYIDSGFGLLSSEVAYLTSVLIAIDITLAGLFWALSGEDNVPAQLIKKVLYVGFFALLLNNFQSLAGIVFQSFAGLGLKASGASLSAADLMRPGFVAATGFDAGKPLLAKAGELAGFTSFFQNFVTIAVLLLAWVIVLLAFFILAVQLFIAILEFKLTTLAGFILVPFALFGRTAFLAERVLGNIISSGVKLMVLAIVIGIGSGVFGELMKPIAGEIALNQAAALILGAVAVFGLAIFVPSIAAGLITGAPQLGAGAAVATTAGLAAAGIGGASLAAAGISAGARLGGGAVKAAASMTGAASAAYETGGVRGLASAAIAEPMRRAASSVSEPVSDAYAQGAAYGYRATGPNDAAAAAEPSSDPSSHQGGAPAWARRLARCQRIANAATALAHTVRDGDRPGMSPGPSLTSKD